MFVMLYLHRYHSSRLDNLAYATFLNLVSPVMYESNPRYPGFLSEAFP